MRTLSERYLSTYTGKKFFPFDPRPEQICIEDIAHGLSMLCRFSGQCPCFYSVAELSGSVRELGMSDEPPRARAMECTVVEYGELERCPSDEDVVPSPQCWPIGGSMEQNA